VIGGFTVSHHKTINGFHLTFTEEGESAFCAGGEREGKSGTISIRGKRAIPIIRSGATWQVAASTGSIGGGSLQPEEVAVIAPNGRSSNGLLSMTLVTRKGLRYGAIEWASDTCNVAFVVQPG
jgi:hypothetical protein